jgi:hypothetical protein
VHVLEALGLAQLRPVVGAVDIGAFEYGTSSGPVAARRPAAGRQPAEGRRLAAAL